MSQANGTELRISSAYSQETVSTLDSLEWYHCHVDRHIAETLLLNNGQEGSFLLRDRSGGVVGTNFVLSVRAKGAVNHYEAKWDGTYYNFGFAQFKTLQEFNDHVLKQTLIAGENGVLTVLKYPYPKRVQEPSLYDKVVIHGTIGKNKSIIARQNLSIATKEGYLTKRGGNIKNWKTRWISVNGVKLKYYKDRKDEEPIRTLNLEECTECQFDNTFTKEKDVGNCFRLVFPWRTFYFCSTTRQEAEEWVQLLKWKVKSIAGDVSDDDAM